MLSDRLGTARLQEPAHVVEKYPYALGAFWLGRAEDGSAIGYRDDRHICVVSGTRGGKGTSIIINNLCLWPGSAVVIDPKGENATVTAARRGRGDEYCTGIGQTVHVLDPFNAATVDDCYRSSFNPLADLDPESEETLEEAHRIANSIVIVRDDAKDPIWDESARTMLRGLILHVLSADAFENERNLLTVRKLIQCGERELADRLRELCSEDKEIDPPHLLLWKAMEENPAFAGTVAGIGAQFRIMMEQSPKTLQSVLHTALTHTEFIDSPGMRRVLSGAGRTFRLSELKTDPQGVTLYLSLPLRQLRNTHYRWLRMMADLITTQMEITRRQPATGYPLLMFLDEFKSLRRMEIIEDAAAQVAGSGMKICFVVQSLEQLKATYKDNWETFLSNAGLKIFFSIEDQFSRDHVSKLAGETEIIRELQNFSESEAQNESLAHGTSRTHTDNQSTTRGDNQSTTHGETRSRTAGTSFAQAFGLTHSDSQSQTEGVNRSSSDTESFGTNQSAGRSRGSSSSTKWPFPMGFNNSVSGSKGSSHGRSHGTNEGTSSSTTSGTTDGTSRTSTHGRSTSDAYGKSTSNTDGRSTSETRGTSDATGTSETYTTGKTHTAGTGRGETLHKRPLIQPDEVGRVFGRIDDKASRYYPGLALVMVAGADPLVVQRTHYFEDAQFIDCFSPHPDHAFMPAVAHAVTGIRPLIEKLEAAINGRRLTIARWFIEPGKLTAPGQFAATIEHVPPDDRTVHIPVPYSGKVSEVAQDMLVSAEYAIPDGNLFAVKNYPDIEQDSGIDPFAELRAACAALENPKAKILAQPSRSFNLRRAMPALAAAAVIFVILGVVLLVANIHSNSGGGYQAEPTTTAENTQPAAPAQKPQPPKGARVKARSAQDSGAVPQPAPDVNSMPDPIKAQPVKRNAARDTLTPATPENTSHEMPVNVESILSQADAALDRHDLERASALYHQAADAGSPRGMATFAHLLFRADDNENADQIHDLYLKAAEMGNAEAMGYAAHFYYFGRKHFPQDFNQAMKWARKGADLGDTLAMDVLGSMYERGQAVPKDITQAVFWYRRAATAPQKPGQLDVGVAGAMFNLRRLGVPDQ